MATDKTKAIRVGDYNRVREIVTRHYADKGLTPQAAERALQNYVQEARERQAKAPRVKSASA